MAKSPESFTITQFAVIAVCFVLQIIDGMDVLVVAYAGPQIIEEWGITKGTYGYIFSAGVAGMTMGSFFLTPFADIIGRRWAVLAAVTIIASSMLLTAFVTSIAQLLTLRFIVGLGIGLAGPTLSTIAAEYSPPRYRDFVVSIIGAGFAVGAMLTGVVAAYIVPEYGWRAMFITAAAVTGIMLPVAFVMLPESLEFLLKKQPPGALAQANQLLGRLGRPQLDKLPATTAEKRSGLGVGNLLVENRRRSTLGLWVGFFMVYATVYFLLGFVPTIVKDMGSPRGALHTGGHGLQPRRPGWHHRPWIAVHPLSLSRGHYWFSSGFSCFHGGIRCVDAAASDIVDVDQRVGVFQSGRPHRHGGGGGAPLPD